MHVALVRIINYIQTAAKFTGQDKVLIRVFGLRESS